MDPSPRVTALISAARALVQAGQTERAADMVGQALQLATDIEDQSAQATALTEVAGALAQSGQTDRAADMVRSALQIATDIDDPERRARALAAVVSKSAGPSGGDPEVGERALELLLLTPGAPDYLAVFPIALLRRLAVDGHLRALQMRGWEAEPVHASPLL